MSNKKSIKKLVLPTFIKASVLGHELIFGRMQLNDLRSSGLDNGSLPNHFTSEYIYLD